jgi:hypothetical protein
LAGGGDTGGGDTGGDVTGGGVIVGDAGGGGETIGGKTGGGDTGGEVVALPTNTSPIENDVEIGLLLESSELVATAPA